MKANKYFTENSVDWVTTYLEPEGITVTWIELPEEKEARLNPKPFVRDTFSYVWLNLNTNETKR